MTTSTTGRLMATLLLLAFAPGCGLEACVTLQDFEPTPVPQAAVSGRLTGLPIELESRLGAAPFTVRAISVDDVELASADVSYGDAFVLELGEEQDHFNLRLVATAGDLTLMTLVPQVAKGREVEVGALSTEATAASLVALRYVARDRPDLASTPTGTLHDVWSNAADAERDDAVSAFHDVMRTILLSGDTASGATTFNDDGTVGSDALLGRAGVDVDTYLAALEAAVDASVVPVVCDPSRIRVLFTVDVSGDGKDGNGAPQFIRQPSKEGKVFLGITLDPTSPIPDSAGTLRPRLTPNDPLTEMVDDGTRGDEVAGDSIFSLALDLPRGMRVLYKYTNGSPGEGFTGTEEWPGNARILVVDDVLTSNESGLADCLVVRRDVFGDESSNKNFVNLHASLGGGDLGYNMDLGGPDGDDGDEALVGGIFVEELRSLGTLSPAGIAEARENGRCTRCPAPLTVSADDEQAPRVVAAQFISGSQTRVVFSEDIDVQTGGDSGNYLLTNASNDAVSVVAVQVVGAQVVLTHDRVDPRRAHVVNIKDVADASLSKNAIDAVEVEIGPDQTPPLVVDVRPGSIVELNPAARPADPQTGEVVVVTFSEVLDRVSAERVQNYAVRNVEGAAVEVYAAYQRDRDVFLVTGQQSRGDDYELRVDGVFDLAGNVLRDEEPHPFGALSLTQVTFHAVVEHAFTSIDGSERGLPDGSELYLTGTIMQDARALDGADLRVQGRTDVAGVPGFAFVDDGTTAEGDAQLTLSIRVPPGTYAFKLAHGREGDHLNPAQTLEGVTKALSTRNDAAGVRVDPRSMLGQDGLSYAGARLSVDGQDVPGPGVLFKRETPDVILTVGEDDVELAPVVISAWRDVPFGQGRDYDDGLLDMPLLREGDVDEQGPVLTQAAARDSESVLLSFDERITAVDVGSVTVTGEDDVALRVIDVVVGAPLPNQLLVRVGAMALAARYEVRVAGVEDDDGNSTDEVRATLSSPTSFVPFTPVVDEDAPVVTAAVATSPTSMELRFNERLDPSSVTLAQFSLSHRTNGDAPDLLGVRLKDGDRTVALTTGPQERQSAYRVSFSDVEDLAGNGTGDVDVDVDGYGEFDPPTMEWAYAISPTQVVVKWSEPVEAVSAGQGTNYTLNGPIVEGVRFSGAETTLASAFNTSWAPTRSDVVVLTTSPMNDGAAYDLTAVGVQDLSGNESGDTASFVGVGAVRTVDVLLTYTISDLEVVIGVGSGGAAGVPARAISEDTLAEQREGVFVLGTALTDDGSAPLASSPINDALSGFPEEGAPLDGVEPQLLDDGTQGDETAGDGVYSLLVQDVPLGTTFAYKAFASFTAAFGASNPEVPGAAFADATMGPSVFGDGQEYPGNDNAVLLLGSPDLPAVIEVNNLFGDEITFKRKTGFPAFHFVLDDAGRLR